MCGNALLLRIREKNKVYIRNANATITCAVMMIPLITRPMT